MKVCLLGASGHGKVVYSILKALGYQNIVIADDNPTIQSFMGISVMHDYSKYSEESTKFIISIGNNRIRKGKAESIAHDFLLAVHPTAMVADDVEIGIGTVVMHKAAIQIGSRVGEHTIVNTGAVVDHDCRIADFVHIAPNVTLCGGVEVGEGSLIGAGSTVIPMIKIGKWCTIGAGSVVIRDVPDGVTVAGNPAKVIVKKTN